MNWHWFWRHTPYERFRSFVITRVFRLTCPVCGWSLDPLARHSEYIHGSASEWERRYKDRICANHH